MWYHTCPQQTPKVRQRSIDAWCCSQESNQHVPKKKNASTRLSSCPPPIRVHLEEPHEELQEAASILLDTDGAARGDAPRGLIPAPDDQQVSEMVAEMADSLKWQVAGDMAGCFIYQSSPKMKWPVVLEKAIRKTVSETLQVTDLIKYWSWSTQGGKRPGLDLGQTGLVGNDRERDLESGLIVKVGSFSHSSVVPHCEFKKLAA